MAVVQSTDLAYNTTGSATCACSFATLPTAGHFIAVTVWCYGVTPGSFVNFSDGAGDVTDNQGNDDYARAVATIDDRHQVAIYYKEAIAIAGGTFTITATWHGVGGTQGYYVMRAYEVDDVIASGSLDRISFDSSAGTTTPTSGAIPMMTQADEIAFAALMAGTVDQASITVESTSPAWVEAAEVLDADLAMPGEADYKILSAADTFAANWTLATSQFTHACLATFKLTGGSGGSCALSGTITGAVTEDDIRTGGKQIILTLSGDTWIA